MVCVSGENCGQATRRSHKAQAVRRRLRRRPVAAAPAVAVPVLAVPDAVVGVGLAPRRAAPVPAEPVAERLRRAAEAPPQVKVARGPRPTVQGPPKVNHARQNEETRTIQWLFCITLERLAFPARARDCTECPFRARQYSYFSSRATDDYQRQSQPRPQRPPQTAQESKATLRSTSCYFKKRS